MSPRACAAALSLTLAGCAGGPFASCPAGQERLATAQLYLGAKVEGAARISPTDLRRFVDQEITPRFPDGLTILDGGGQWVGPENRLLREAAKVVLIVLPAKGDGEARVEGVRQAYR